MNKVFLDKNDNVLGWCDSDKEIQIEGSVRTILQDMEGKSPATVKLSGEIVISKTSAEISADKRSVDEKAIMEKKITLQVRISAMETLGMDCKAEKDALAGLS